MTKILKAIKWVLSNIEKQKKFYSYKNQKFSNSNQNKYQFKIWEAVYNWIGCPNMDRCGLWTSGVKKYGAFWTVSFEKVVDSQP